MKKVRWGIVATGYISDRFVEGLKYCDGAVIEAVASRSISRADSFASKHDIEKFYGSYEDMLDDKQVDIVYIGTPNTSHVNDVIMFLNAGFNVLCEKPIGVNANEVREMISIAKEKDLFLMEAIWTSFFPAVQKAVEWVKSGKIGEVKTLSASFGYDGSGDRNQWRFKKSAAGGALLDVGIYPLSIAFSIFGTSPNEVLGVCHEENGIDEYNSIILKYNEGIAGLSSGITVKMSQKVLIEGSKGRVIIHDNWWCASKAELVLTGDDAFSYNGNSEVFEAPYESNGLQFEAQAVHNCLNEGLKESPVMPLDESLKLAATMDKLRGMWGIKYPSDT